MNVLIVEDNPISAMVLEHRPLILRCYRPLRTRAFRWSGNIAEATLQGQFMVT